MNSSGGSSNFMSKQHMFREFSFCFSFAPQIKEVMFGVVMHYSPFLGAVGAWCVYFFMSCLKMVCHHSVIIGCWSEDPFQSSETSLVFDSSQTCKIFVKQIHC